MLIELNGNILNVTNEFVQGQMLKNGGIKIEEKEEPKKEIKKTVQEKTTASKTVKK